MSKLAVAVAISLVAVIAAGAWLLGADRQREATSGSELTEENIDSAKTADERLLALQQMIVAERNARMVLEDQLQALLDDIERIDSSGSRTIAESRQRAEEIQRESRRREAGRERPDYATLIQRMQERRLKSLVDGGFSEDEARRILQQESEAQYKALQAAHDAQRNGERTNAFSMVNDPGSLLREELGDVEYERYLKAQGQPATVQVTQVLGSSPGDRAGIQPGDEIVSYNGERVFSVNDLRALTLQGTAGEDVVVEIERDGVRMQLNVQRGPVGITGSSANVRNVNWWGGT